MSKIGTREEYHITKGKKVFSKEDCPFCNYREVENTLIKSFSFWDIILNKYPYSGNEHHLMAVPKRHIIFSYEINSEEILELREIYDFMRDFYQKVGEKDYFMATRETMGNRSIEHYHMHFIPGRLQGKFLRCMLENQGYPIEAEISIKK